MQHQGMREWNDFYQEAYSELRQFPRETDHEFTERVAARADQKFQEYRNYVIQEGLFGFDKIPASSPEVPWKYTGYFGKDPNRGSEYIVRLPIAYQVDRHDRLTKKQLTSIHMAQERSEEICKGFRDLLYDKYRSKFDLKNEDDVWNYVTPAKVLVPIDPADQYFVLFVFDVDDQEEPSYWSWSLPVRGRKGVADGKSKFANVDNISEKKIASMKLLDRKGVKMESAEIKKPQFSRFFQEAIDFGNTDEAPAAGDGNGVSFDEAPAADGDAPALDASADGQKEVVDTNDVSDQIAEKVADETEAKNASDDLNIDAANTDATDDTSVDLSDTPSDDEIEAIMNSNTTHEFTEITDKTLVNAMAAEQNRKNTDPEAVAVNELDPDGDGIEVHDISGPMYHGKMLVIYDPSRVMVATIDDYNHNGAGLTLKELIDKYDGVAGVNGGQYEDTNGMGIGGWPEGIVISEGELRMGVPGGTYDVYGLTNDNVLVVGRMTAQHAMDIGVRDAVSFGPALIVNGVPANYSGSGGGLNPRTAIGQREDGAILLLVIEGRKTSSMGATMADLIDVMKEYGAVNAANLDGGMSSAMWYNNEELVSSSSIRQSRKMPTAFVVMPKGSSEKTDTAAAEN